MVVSGFVLAGGKSSRMGRDKALLPYRGATLVQHIAAVVGEALRASKAGDCVAIVGLPERYGKLGYPVHPDLVADCGPLGGIYTALRKAASDWNLVVACDMPQLSSSGLGTLLVRIRASRANCILAAGPGGEPEPLCGVYHRRCLPTLERALQDKRFRMRDLVPELGIETVPVGAAALANVNTPADWTELEGQPR